ncbi:peptidyl-prolyl cis-trans isomerase [Parabacteroides sp. PF5-9]|uniref:peptidyl-prolyl cis-trans isomerase n=1 Tax=Parabacteroides sp. PF5-9 TaxID=1742404 RepID=UPI002475231D|nr:peptidyl-prolyl cis-trans isomerase [Parabacteroides sp. PF5-9]MDH6358806.1 hypothetical protein [Parabacteroides sp. PF5-9]
MRHSYFIITLLIVCLSACKQTPTISDAEVIATVGDRALRISEVTQMIPRGATPADSLLHAESYVKKWVKDALVDDIASRNLGDEKAEIDRLVDDYRRSLTRYRYLERLIRERLSADIRESDKLNYYEENQQKFVLEKGLVKGLFLKLPIDAPGLSDVKGWYKSTSNESLEKIEKYSVQNAIIYDYFYDRWVDFDEVMDNIPMRITNSNEFLRTNKHIEVSDSSYCYLLNINEYIPSGKIAPYDYVGTQIVDLLINQRRMEYLKQFEDELYNDGIKNGRVKLSK